MSDSDDNSFGALARHNRSNVKLIANMCSRIRQDLDLLQELVEDLLSTLKAVNNDCGVVVDMTARRMKRDVALTNPRRYRRQQGVDETE